MKKIYLPAVRVILRLSLVAAALALSGCTVGDDPVPPPPPAKETPLENIQVIKSQIEVNESLISFSKGKIERRKAEERDLVEKRKKLQDRFDRAQILYSEQFAKLTPIQKKYVDGTLTIEQDMFGDREIHDRGRETFKTIMLNKTGKFDKEASAIPDMMWKIKYIKDDLEKELRALDEKIARVRADVEWEEKNIKKKQAETEKLKVDLARLESEKAAQVADKKTKGPVKTLKVKSEAEETPFRTVRTSERSADFETVEKRNDKLKESHHAAGHDRAGQGYRKVADAVVKPRPKPDTLRRFILKPRVPVSEPHRPPTIEPVHLPPTQPHGPGHHQ